MTPLFHLNNRCGKRLAFGPAGRRTEIAAGPGSADNGA